jgi:phosphoribosyl-AMP cyclohydrolase / phosphoribosyl-ATP pyrophosphohydrolase
VTASGPGGAGASPAGLVFDAQGLAPAIVQDAEDGDVLMLAYVDREAVRRTLATGTTWFWSRSRGEYWNKGATSGNKQKVVEVRYDCDADALLILVEPAGPACHTGRRSCFYRTLT